MKQDKPKPIFETFACGILSVLIKDDYIRKNYGSYGIELLKEIGWLLTKDNMPVTPKKRVRSKTKRGEIK